MRFSTGVLRWGASLMVVSVALTGCSATNRPEPISAEGKGTIGAASVPTETRDLAIRVAQGDRAAELVQALRDRGPEGLQALLEAASGLQASERAALRPTIEKVAQQRDADVSQLYWYTDIEKAKSASRDSQKPILSLRLLGRLTDELSCANSRFFRAALYANQELSRVLRERFILHWSTEREAPTVTIDYGDGRKIVRTITGNSIHYVLDEDGRVLDAIPGLYGPKQFEDALVMAESLANAMRGLSDRELASALSNHHELRVRALEQAWRSETVAAGLGELPAPAGLPGGNKARSNPPAAMAMPLAGGKSLVEAPILRATERNLPTYELGAPDEVYQALADRKLASVKLDAQSRSLMARKRPMSWTDPSGPRALDAAELDALVAAFEREIALDTVKNEYWLHAQIHRELASRSRVDLATFNQWVYSKLFLTPSNDPWLGMVPPEAFTGIEADGLVSSR